MPVLLRTPLEADAASVTSLLLELGYPSTEMEIRNRLCAIRDKADSFFLIASAENDVIGFLSAELIPYFPNGSTICRVTALVVSTHFRGRGTGTRLLAGAADFARERKCAGIEITSAEHRLDAHRFYQQLGFSRTSFRFFRSL